jgi:hypothetical protein
MTDRELLELAAKAAGLTMHRYCEPWNAMARYTMADGYRSPSWNPLTDDGEALRLAVKLELVVDTHGLFVRASHPFAEPFASEERGADPYAATRRAIVRAAAAIGSAS